MGANALPANLLEFNKPMTRSSKSEAKEGRTNGIRAAIMAVCSMRTATKLVRPGLTDSKNCKKVPKIPAARIKLYLLTFTDNLHSKKVPAIADAVYSITTNPAYFTAILSPILYAWKTFGRMLGMNINWMDAVKQRPHPISNFALITCFEKVDAFLDLWGSTFTKILQKTRVTKTKAEALMKAPW